MSKYVVTMRWYVETNDNFEKELTEISIEEKKKRIVELIRYKSNGEKCSDICATRNCESFVVLDWKDFYDKKPIYISTKDIKE